MLLPAGMSVEGGVTTAGDGPGWTSGPTALRMLLGAHLRRLREAQGVSREDAGWEIRASESKISRLELGRVSFKERDIADLLTLYGVDDEKEKERLLTLARRANTPGWWHRYGDILPSWFQSYLGLEASAALIRTYEIQFVPGLLQTEDYARAVVRLGHGRASDDEIDRRVALRMRRQEILQRPDPVQLWAVLDEAVLRRPIGSTAIMRSQLELLLEATSRPNVRLQVVPFRAGGHSAAGGAFSILRFPDQELPDIVYVEQLTSALYLDKREDVEHYLAAIERLCVEADQPDRTRTMLGSILRSD
jgi:transcriptional regulator with XRE-family HTH domain